MRKGSTRRPQDDSPAVHVKNYITPAGLARLKGEHQFLLNKNRPAVAVVVAWAAGNGDRSENADSQYGKRYERITVEPFREPPGSYAAARQS